MSGHNKWSKIKRQKGSSDAEKSKAFGKIVRYITVEAKKSGGNVTSPGLAAAIKKAKEENMPNDTINRAIKKATTDNSAQMENITYEAYGPGGCALVIEALTDNRNKAAQEIKHILSNHGFTLAAMGAATWAFEKTHEGWIAQTKAEISDEDGQKLNEVIEDLEANDEVQEVFYECRIMRIIAIDPGYERLGVAILEKEKKGKEQLIYSACIQTSKNLPHHERLAHVSSEVLRLIAEFAPEALAIETLFFSKNQKTAMLVAEARGAILATASLQHLAVHEMSRALLK